MTGKTLLKRIVVDPKIMLGKPVIKGTRLPVEIIVEKVAYGATLDDLKRNYPFLKEKGWKALEGTANGRNFWTKSVSLTRSLLRMEEAGQTSELR